MTDHILTLNAGSSSLKFAVYACDDNAPTRRALGQIEGIGTRPRFSVDAPVVRDQAWAEGDGPDTHDAALSLILGWFSDSFAGTTIAAVGHRIVHGGPDFVAPMVLDTPTLKALGRFSPLAPLHQPHNLAGVKAAITCFPDAVQIGCFDTAFHRQHPWVNDTYALPKRFYDEGVRRYGFHGLSYEYVTGELQRLRPEVAKGRCIIAHLGNGASMCAIKDGKSVASTMGFSVIDGLTMGTRCGQIDPGVLLYLMSEHELSADEVRDVLTKESGLLGLSGISHDMRELEASSTPDAERAIDYFVHAIRREVGALTATLSGVDAVIFCGGIGENSRTVRARVCEELDWLGISINPDRNSDNATIISSDEARCPVMVIKTDEEQMIARHTHALLAEPG